MRRISRNSSRRLTPHWAWALVFSAHLLAQQSNFIPITPCRVVDTRNTAGTFGGPILAGNSSRSFPVPQSACSIPATATAYSLNVTLVPSGPVGFVTLWPSGSPQPVVATLNDLEGQIRGNAAIVPAGTPNGAISIYVTNQTHVVIDANGYFAPAVAGPPGQTGPQGPTGATGATGPAGAVGPIGPMGTQGPQGQPGPAGAVGITGPPGTPGTKITCDNIAGPSGHPCFGIVAVTNSVDQSVQLAVNSVIFPRLQNITSANGTNAYTGAGNPSWSSYTQYPVFIFTPDVDCRGTNDTLNVDNLGMVTLRINVNGQLTATVAGSCRAGMPYVIVPHLSSASGNISGIDGFVIYQ